MVKFVYTSGECCEQENHKLSTIVDIRLDIGRILLETLHSMNEDLDYADDMERELGSTV